MMDKKININDLLKDKNIQFIYKFFKIVHCYKEQSIWLKRIIANADKISKYHIDYPINLLSSRDIFGKWYDICIEESLPLDTWKTLNEAATYLWFKMRNQEGSLGKTYLNHTPRHRELKQYIDEYLLYKNGQTNSKQLKLF